MNRRDDWQESQHALRKLLYKIPVGNRNAPSIRDITCHYKFGLVLHQRKQIWYIYNLKTDNIIATVKRGYDRVVIRYRKNSIYSDILSRYQYDCPTVNVQSPNLRRNLRWVRDSVRSRLESHYTERRASFLALADQPTGGQGLTRFSITIPQPVEYVSSLTPFGQSEPQPITESRITVLFSSQSEFERHREEAQEIVRRIARDGHISELTEMFYRPEMLEIEVPMRELVRFYNGYQERDRREREAYRQMYRDMHRRMREAGGYGVEPHFFQEFTPAESVYGVDVGEAERSEPSSVATYMGYPVRQLRNYIATTSEVAEGTALTERDLMEAVEALRNESVPAGHIGWDRGAIARLVEEMPQASDSALEQFLERRRDVQQD